MEEIISSIISGIATKYLSNYSEEAVTRFFNWAIGKKPQLKELLRKTKTHEDVENIFKEAVGILNANAGSGTIDIDQTMINAIRSAKFNHANGTVTIDDSTIYAPKLVTGGDRGATGTTTITGTNLKSRGTEIKMGKKASIKMSGSARIEQN